MIVSAKREIRQGTSAMIAFLLSVFFFLSHPSSPQPYTTRLSLSRLFALLPWLWHPGTELFVTQ